MQVGHGLGGKVVLGGGSRIDGEVQLLASIEKKGGAKYSLQELFVDETLAGIEAKAGNGQYGKKCLGLLARNGQVREGTEEVTVIGDRRYDGTIRFVRNIFDCFVKSRKSWIGMEEDVP